jgi:hypothetical protein
MKVSCVIHAPENSPEYIIGRRLRGARIGLDFVKLIDIYFFLTSVDTWLPS